MSMEPLPLYVLGFEGGAFGGRARLASPAEILSAARAHLDYEAALSEYLRLRWAEDGMGPYAEELADEVLPNGVQVPRISNFEETKRIVAAALGLTEEEA